MPRYRYYPPRSANRFDNYKELVSKFDSVGACGHPIKKGQVIGWHAIHKAQCAACWSRWVEENREADALEGRFMGYEPEYRPEAEW